MKRSDRAEHDAGHGERPGAADEEPHHIRVPRAERHPDPISWARVVTEYAITP